MTTAHVAALREIVTDIVTDRVALEAHAQRPLGLVNRRFETITGDLMFFPWEREAHKPVAQIVAEICGTKRTPRGRRHPDSRARWRRLYGNRRYS